ncbi:MAG: hypothetical protein ACI379_17415 [Nocardioides sp.]
MLSALTVVASEAHEAPIPAPLVGIIAFAILTIALLGVVWFGGGREHS